MIRILHIVSSMNCGGTENFIMNVYRNIDRSKIQFDFLKDNEEKSFFDDEILSMGGKIYNVPRWNIRNSFSYMRALKNFLKSHEEYRLVHGHAGSNSFLYSRCAKSCNRCVILHSHSIKGSGMSLQNLLFKLCTYPARYVSDAFFACSEAAGKVRFGKRVINSERFRIVKNAIETERFSFDEQIRDNVRREYNLSDKFVIGHIGRFDYAKNHSFLLSVFAEILKLRKDAVLLLLGDGELRAETEQKSKELGILDNVVFLGVRADANEFLHAMDCFVFPSLNEGLGIVTIEAQCNGLPCFINETLPTELDINSNLHRLSLQSGPDVWAREIVEKAKRIPVDEAVENVRQAGYDIKQVANELSDFYIKRNGG